MDTEWSVPRITGFRKFLGGWSSSLSDPLRCRTGRPDALGMHGLPDWAWPAIQVLPQPMSAIVRPLGPRPVRTG